MTVLVDPAVVEPILMRARQCAIDYYELTRKPLGISGEIGEFLAAKLLGMELTVARTPGYDAIDQARRKIQIKCRVVENPSRIAGQRIGSIRLDHAWDIVILIVMNRTFEPQVIYEAERSAIAAALIQPGSRARNERGALSVHAFRRIGKQVWP